jgi:hypothetical protein
MLHNASAYLADLKQVAGIRRHLNNPADALEIERSVIALEAGEDVDTEWTNHIAKRFIHGLS